MKGPWSVVVAVILSVFAANRGLAIDPPQVAAAVDGFESPQEAFQAYMHAFANEDWRASFNCLPPNERCRPLMLVAFLVVADHSEKMNHVAWDLDVDWRTAEDLLTADWVSEVVTLFQMAGVNSEVLAEWCVADCRGLESQLLDRLGVWQRVTRLVEVAWSDGGARMLRRSGIDIRKMEEDILKNPPTEKLCGIGEAYFKFLEQEAKRQAKPQDIDRFISNRYFAKVADPAGLYQRLMHWDASGLSAEERKMAKDQFAQFSTVKLANVVINGDSATGVPIDGETGKPTGGEQQRFKKIHGRWFFASGF